MRTNQQPLSGSTGEIETLVSAFRQHEEIINRFIQLVENRCGSENAQHRQVGGCALRRHERITKGDQPTNEQHVTNTNNLFA
jgi:hypothetical protein